MRKVYQGMLNSMR